MEVAQDSNRIKNFLNRLRLSITWTINSHLRASLIISLLALGSAILFGFHYAFVSIFGITVALLIPLVKTYNLLKITIAMSLSLFLISQISNNTQISAVTIQLLYWLFVLQILRELIDLIFHHGQSR